MLPQFPEVNRPQAKEDPLQNEAGTSDLTNSVGRAFSGTAPPQYSSWCSFPCRTVREGEYPALKAPASWLDLFLDSRRVTIHVAAASPLKDLTLKPTRESAPQCSLRRTGIGAYWKSCLESNAYIPPKNYWTGLQITNTETQHKHYHVILPDCFPA